MAKRTNVKREVKGSSAVARWSLILGILAVLLTIQNGMHALIWGIPAIILGITSLKTANRRSAIAGIGAGVLALLIAIVRTTIVYYTVYGE